MKKLTAPILLVGTPSELADLRYASGFSAVDPVVYLHAPRKRCLVVPTMELGRARREAHRGVAVCTPASLGLTHKDQRRISSWALGALRAARIRHVMVSRFFPLGVAERLRRNGIHLEVADVMLFPQREVKSAAEIRWIRESQVAAVAAMQSAVAMIRAARVNRAGHLVHRGSVLTSESVRCAIEHVLVDHNCIARETIVSCGRDAAEPHARGSGPLKAGVPIVIDIFPQHKEHGYWGDLTRTVVKGRADEQLKRMYRAVFAAQRAALDELRAGVTGKTVDGKVRDVFEKRGFVTAVSGGVAEGFTHSTGHGVGLDIHEFPSLSPMGGRLRAGHVVTVEPGLYYRRFGGVRIEDTVVVTARGWKPLAKCACRLEV